MGLSSRELRDRGRGPGPGRVLPPAAMGLSSRELRDPLAGSVPGDQRKLMVVRAVMGGAAGKGLLSVVKGLKTGGDLGASGARGSGRHLSARTVRAPCFPSAEAEVGRP